MKCPIIILTILLFSSSLFAQYQTGGMVYDTIVSGQFYQGDLCFPEEVVNIELDQPLLDYVSGLDLWLKITEINIPQGSLETNVGVLNVNDSLLLGADNSYYPFFLTDIGSFRYAVIAQGVPEVEHEVYPCEILTICSLTHCKIGCIITGEFSYEDCEVESSVSTTSYNKEKSQIEIYPNPSSGVFTINNKLPNSNSLVSIYNSLGQLVLNSRIENNTSQISFDLSSNPSGIYLIQIYNKHSTFSKMLYLE